MWNESVHLRHRKLTHRAGQIINWGRLIVIFVAAVQNYMQNQLIRGMRIAPFPWSCSSVVKSETEFDVDFSRVVIVESSKGQAVVK